MYELDALRSSLEDATEISSRDYGGPTEELLEDLFRLLSMVRHSVTRELLKREQDEADREEE